MKKILPLLVCVLLCTACGDKPLYDEEHTFERNTWNRFTPEVFEMNVNNVKDYYHIETTVAVDTTVYRYEQLPVMFILHGANGEERQFYGAVVLKDKGRWRGEMQNGWRVATGRIRSYFSFNKKGSYRADVSQATSQYDLEGIHSLRLTVTKAPVDYDL